MMHHLHKPSKNFAARTVAVIMMLIYTNMSHTTSILYFLETRRDYSSPTIEASAGEITTLPFFTVYHDLCGHLAYRGHAEGALFDVRYHSGKFWIQGMTAVSSERIRFLDNTLPNRKFSRTGIDDIILVSGYNFLPHKKTQIIGYLQAGFPTKKFGVILEDFPSLIGTGLFSFGPGLELSYALFEDNKQTLGVACQARLLHFFKSSIKARPSERLHPGNETDALWSLHYRRWEHHIDVGYVITAYTNSFINTKQERRKLSSLNENNVYISYMYQPENLPIVLGSGVWDSFAREGKLNSLFGWIFFSLVF